MPKFNVLKIIRAARAAKRAANAAVGEEETIREGAAKGSRLFRNIRVAIKRPYTGLKRGGAVIARHPIASGVVASQAALGAYLYHRSRKGKGPIHARIGKTSIKIVPKPIIAAEPIEADLGVATLKVRRDSR